MGEAPLSCHTPTLQWLLYVKDQTVALIPVLTSVPYRRPFKKQDLTSGFSG